MPQTIAFSPTPFLRAVYGAGSALGARASALANLLLPVNMRRSNLVSSYVRFDAVVTDHNPFLAAIILRRLVDSGKSCLLISGQQQDEWPYDLLFSPSLRDLLSSLSLEEDDFTYDPDSLPARLITQHLRAVAEQITVTRSFAAVYPSKKHPSGCLALLGSPRQDDYKPVDDRHLAELHGSLRNVLFYSPRLTAPSWGQLAIFTDELVLTGARLKTASPPQDENRLNWGNRRITAMGSAQFTDKSTPAAAHQLLEELASWQEVRRSLGI